MRGVDLVFNFQAAVGVGVWRERDTAPPVPSSEPPVTDTPQPPGAFPSLRHNRYVQLEASGVVPVCRGSRDTGDGPTAGAH